MEHHEMSNSLATRAQPFIEEVEDLEEEMTAMQSAHMAAMKAKRKIRGEIFARAKDNDIPVTPLKTHLKVRKLERKCEAAKAELDLDERAAYDELAAGALGDLGVAAARAAGYGNANGGDDRDVRPRHMQHDDTAIDRVGRGS